jgi:hypothetical protein
VGSYANERAAKRIAELRGRGLDLVTFWCEARDAIASAVPYYITPCWFTLDPTSLLVTSHHDHGHLGEFPAEWLAQEYYEDDFDLHSLVDVARSKAGISTLHEATGGDPSRSRAWREYVHRTEPSRSWDWPYGRQRERFGGCSLFTVSQANRYSLEMSGGYCSLWRPTSPRVLGAGS